MDTVIAPSRSRAARTAAAVLTALAVGLAGCGGDGTASAPASAPVDAAAPSGLPVGTVLIDVRTPEEFDTGHLEGALNLPVELAAFPDQVAALDPDAEYLVYCRSGRRADLAVEYMTGLGLDARNLGSVAEASAETGVPVTG
ncbi:MAG: rhodanese-like domain-containing protein [Nitriliruptoraceae bacterium]